MACMEYECADCGEFWSNNEPQNRWCPKCGSEHIISAFDEMEYDEYEEMEYDEYEEMEYDE